MKDPKGTRTYHCIICDHEDIGGFENYKAHSETKEHLVKEVAFYSDLSEQHEKEAADAQHRLHTAIEKLEKLPR